MITRLEEVIILDEFKFRKNMLNGEKIYGYHNYENTRS